MEDNIAAVALQKDIQANVINKDLVQKTKEHALPSIAYYPVSVLTLGLPQTLKGIHREWGKMQRERDLDTREFVHGINIAGYAFAIVGQVVVMGYLYYSALENPLR